MEFHSRVVSASAAADGGSPPPLPGPAEPTLPLEEASALVKRALKAYASLPLELALADQLRPLLGSGLPSSASSESVARLVQERILAIVQALAEGNEEEKRYSRILLCAYIKKNRQPRSGGGTFEYVRSELLPAFAQSRAQADI